MDPKAWLKLRVFEVLLPKLWRQRPASNPDQNDTALGHVSDTDRVYRAVMDHAYQLLEQSAANAMQPKLEEHEREFFCGQAHGLMTLISNIESTRERARALRLNEQLKRSNAAR